MEEQIKDSFVIYPTVVESIKKLQPKIRLEVYDALMEYGMTNIVPVGLSSVAEALIISFSGGIASAKSRREANVANGKKGGEYGYLGGRPVKSITPNNPEITPKNPEATPNKPLNVDVDVNVDVNKRRNPRTLSAGFKKHNYDTKVLNSVFSNLDTTVFK